MEQGEVNLALLDQVRFDAAGLIPVIVQDVITQKVLMLAYMNREALALSLKTGRTWFFSRSRQCLWPKGETSGNFQAVEAIYYDCDADALLVLVRQQGVACHEGYYSCFHYQINPEGEVGLIGKKEPPLSTESFLSCLEALVQARKETRPEGSYTASLFNAGQDRILKKVGEEVTELILAAKGGKKEEIVAEAADLFYHLLVLLVAYGLDTQAVKEELARRFRG